MVSILGVIAVIIVLVVAHELGHFLVAKACGMRVEEFAVGFGTRKFTVAKRGGTEYNIRPIPAGGFVRISGMEPGEECPPDGFNAKPVGSRMAVIFAGPLASFLFAYVLFIVLGFTAGLPTGGPLPVVEVVSAGSPAARMGLKAGDTFLRIAGKPVPTGDDMMQTIRSCPGKPIKVVVRRGGETLTLTGTPNAVKDSRTHRVIGRLGFIPSAARERVGFVRAVRQGTRVSIAITAQVLDVLVSPHRMATETGGPIAIASATGQAAKRGLAPLLELTAGLSLNFAVLNLIPIPILDGGTILLLLIELIQRRKLSAQAHQTAAMIGLAVLATIVVLVLAKDISGLFSARP